MLNVREIALYSQVNDDSYEAPRPPATTVLSTRATVYFKSRSSRSSMHVATYLFYLEHHSI